MQMNTWKKYYSVNTFFWRGYFLCEWLVNAALCHQYKEDFIFACVYVVYAYTTAWVTLHVIIRRYLLREKNVQGGIWLAVSIVLFSLGRRACTYIIHDRMYVPDAYLKESYLNMPKVLMEGVWLYLIVAFNTMLYFMRAWYEEQRLSETLKKDKAIAQLELLKSQVHPHFIFNTLNNIYSLSLHQDPKTPDLIHRLSALLSYMLYDSKDAYIPIAKEVEYLYNYIELQKIRYSDHLDVSINIFGPLDDFRITPLLLLPLLENSFKHGVSNEVDGCWIRMDLSRSGDWLVVKVENSRVAGNGQLNGSATTGPVSGIGLANVRRRLEILYPGQHEFKTLFEEQSYLAVLKIKNKAIVLSQAPVAGRVQLNHKDQ